ncbi:MAG: hypothetical protein KAG53_12160 [Endozoicomonadaceae bacterium]|nr:hypothetical protein [Endozoicomonadaceae bacterium]
MSIKFKNNPSFCVLSGFHAVEYKFTTSKKINKLTAFFYLFRRVKLTLVDIDNLLKYNASSSIKKKIFERMVLKSPDTMACLAEKDMKIYKAIKNNYFNTGRPNELIRFQDMPLKEIMDKIKEEKLFIPNEIEWVIKKNSFLCDEELYEFIRERYCSVGREREFDALQQWLSNKTQPKYQLIKRLKEVRLFTKRDIQWIENSTTDFEGSPYW